MDKEPRQALPERRTDLYWGELIQVNTLWSNMEDFLSELRLSVPP